MEPTWRKDYIRYKSYFLNLIGKYRDRSDVKAYIEIILSLVTISVFSIFALRPTLLTIGQLIKEIESRKETLSLMENKIKNLSQAQSLYDKERQNIALLKSAIPQKADPIGLARQFEGLSNKDKAAVLGFSTQQAYLGGNSENQTESPNGTNQGNINELGFDLQASAPVEQYNSLANFVSDLENLRRIVKLNGLTINVNAGKESKSLIININGKVFYY